MVAIDLEHPFLTVEPATVPPILLNRAASRQAPVTVIAGAASRPALSAVREASEVGLMRPILIGDPPSVRAEAEAIGWDVAGHDIIGASGEEEEARLAVEACRDGTAGLLMKGRVHTNVLMRAVLDRGAGLRTGERLVHIFLLTHSAGGRPLAISDAAVNVAPDIDTRKSATRQVASLLHHLGVPRPGIAFLSATETPIRSVPSSLEARHLRDWAQAEIADAEFSGPLALDLVLSPEAARIKGLADDPVAGKADGVIVPDILAGNVLYKTLVHTTGACAAGVVTGARVPILLTSRADPPAARLASVALAGLISDA